MSQFDGISPSAMKAWGLLAKAYPDLAITSGYRDPEHNARVGGAKNSQHTHGNAFDIDTSGWDQARREAFVRDATAAGFSGFGNYDNSMHVDVGPSRVWGASYGADTAPEWLSAAAVGGDAANTPFNPPEGLLSGAWGADTWQDAATNAGGLLTGAFDAPAAPEIAPMQARPIAPQRQSDRLSPYLSFMQQMRS